MSRATHPVLSQGKPVAWSRGKQALTLEPISVRGAGCWCGRWCGLQPLLPGIYGQLLSEEDMSVAPPWRFNWNLKQVSFSPAAPSASEQDVGWAEGTGRRGRSVHPQQRHLSRLSSTLISEHLNSCLGLSTPTALPWACTALSSVGEAC